MPIKPKNLLSGISNTKTRTFVLFFGFILVSGILLAFFNKETSPADLLSQQGSSAAPVPSQIKATPGSIVSPQYKELQTAENIQRADVAAKKQTSAIPTIVGATSDLNADKTNILGIDPNLKTDGPQGSARLQFDDTTSPDFLGGPFGKSAADREREKQAAQLQQERDRIQKIREDKEKILLHQKKMEQAERLAQDEQKAYRSSVDRINNQMKQYAGKAYDEWSKFPKQHYVQGALAAKEYLPNYPEAITASGKTVVVTRGKLTEITTTKSLVPKRVVKAGTVLFGVLDTAINTDEPGPVLATVVSGKFHGAKLLGSLKHEDRQEAVTITFNQMNVPKKLHSVAVSVVAIDPETARTALKSDVNHHYLLRYGTLFASSFVAGYGQAVQQQGSTTTVSPLTGATTTSYPPLDNQQIFLSALGEVGTQWANATREYFRTPYTVKVNQGTGVGLLFMTDADLSVDGE